MELFYFKSGDQINFGDDLNEIIWKALIPDFHEKHPDKILIGCGSLFNKLIDDKISDQYQRFFLGTGVGYESQVGAFTKRDSDVILSTRGPLSCKELCLESSLGIIDSAVLVNEVFNSNHFSKTKVSFMLHHVNAMENGYIYKKACDELGIHYIDVEADPRKVLAEIASSKILYTEALHGAIIADSFRIPWVPLVMSQRILKFKWEDWLQSLNLEYNPYFLSVKGYPNHQPVGLIQKAKERVRLEIFKHDLRKLQFVSIPKLSQDEIYNSKYNQLKDVFYNFKKEYFN